MSGFALLGGEASFLGRSRLSGKRQRRLRRRCPFDKVLPETTDRRNKDEDERAEEVAEGATMLICRSFTALFFQQSKVHPRSVLFPPPHPPSYCPDQGEEDLRPKCVPDLPDTPRPYSLAKVRTVFCLESVWPSCHTAGLRSERRRRGTVSNVDNILAKWTQFGRPWTDSLFKTLRRPLATVDIE